jgi:hypothetical protein
MNFDSWFFILFGVFTFTMGVLNKGGVFWVSTYRSKEFEGKYKRAINIVMGIISVAIGIALG